MKLTTAGLVCGAAVGLIALGISVTSAGPRGGRERALNSVVQVMVETRFGTTRRCSGYLFSGIGYVATTYHALSDAVAISVFHADHGVYDVAAIRRIDPRADIAVLTLAYTDQLNVSCARLGDSRGLRAGDAVHVLHHPAYADEVIHDTVLTNVGYRRQLPPAAAMEGYADELLLLELNGPFDAGSAGGLVCNENYEVVGLLIGGPGREDGERTGYALSSSYLSPLLVSTYEVSWDNIRTNSTSDADLFDKYFGPSPQHTEFNAGMSEGYIVWFAPMHHTEYHDLEFTYEINDKIDKNWFHTADLVVDGRPLREWSASRVFVWPAYINPWDATDTVDQYVHFDADSEFTKRIYRERDIEERTMTRHLLAMPLDPGRHTVQYENRGANYKTTGIKRLRLEISSAQFELIDITGLSLVTMLLLPSDSPGVGEGEPVRYELERRPLNDKELTFGVRSVRYPTRR